MTISAVSNLASRTGKPVKVSPAGRVCAEEGCEVRLSIYNDTDRCAQHVDRIWVSYRA